MRLVFSSLLGFLIGAAVTVLVTVLGVYLALSAERSVSLASIVDVTFVPDGPVAFHYPARSVGEEFGVRS